VYCYLCQPDPIKEEVMPTYTETLTTLNTVAAIVDRLADTPHGFSIDDDAGEWFGIEAWEGFHVDSGLTFGSVPGEPDMGSVEGCVVITDSDGARHGFTVHTTRSGDVVVWKTFWKA
jgi:hypothetical protein